MPNFKEDFIAAFNASMAWEVGPSFNCKDPEVVAGTCKTRVQRLKTGYVNDPADKGGKTKFGIAQNAHPNLNIDTLTLDQAMKIYHDTYWIGSKANQLNSPLSVVFFDAFVNHRPKSAIKLLQTSCGAVVDGDFGPKTLEKANSVNPTEASFIFLDAREDLFRRIVENDSSQKKFLKGWLARVESFRVFVWAQLGKD